LTPLGASLELFVESHATRLMNVPFDGVAKEFSSRRNCGYGTVFELSP
jgi:hypothetical protein